MFTQKEIKNQLYILLLQMNFDLEKKKNLKINNAQAYKIIDKENGKIILDNCTLKSAYSYLIRF